MRVFFGRGLFLFIATFLLFYFIAKYSLVSSVELSLIIVAIFIFIFGSIILLSKYKEKP
jgi:hypothetical protein